MHFLLWFLHPALYHNVCADFDRNPCIYRELTVGEWWDTSFGTVLSGGWKTQIHTKRKKRDRRKERKKTKEKIRKEGKFVEERKKERRNKRQLQ